MQKVAILGAGGLARDALFVFLESNKHSPQWDVLGFIDENPKNHGVILCDLPVLGGFEWFAHVNPKEVKVICAIGNNESRKKVAEKARNLNLDFCTVVSPSAVISSYVEYGKGVVICAGNVIAPQVKIGNHVYVNLACTLGHDAVLHDFVNVAPGSNVSGNVTLEQGVQVGTGCAIIPSVTIGKWSTIGAGSTVINDIPPYSVAVGTPAKVVKTKVH